MRKRKLEVSFIEYRLQDHFSDCIVNIIHQYSKNETDVEYWKTEIYGSDCEISDALHHIIEKEMEFTHNNIHRIIFKKIRKTMDAYLAQVEESWFDCPY
jgi:hypothetical protein